jgi:cytosol alanyl aminopeptidase
VSPRPAWLCLVVLTACGSAQPAPQPVTPTPPPTTTIAIADEAPKLRLPRDTHPTAEAITLQIDPKLDRFSGVADIAITLDRPRSVLWLHGLRLHVTRATVSSEDGASVTAIWQEHEPRGTASLTLPAPLAAGHVKVHIEYDAPFGSKLEGLFKLTQGGAPYAFTQFENIAARQAFPCFDEPGFKIAWDTTLVVPRDVSVLANTQELTRATEGSSVRVHFAPTLPLPSYLIAFAVGPLDVVTAPDIAPNKVRSRPLPLRGAATRGHGAELSYALAHTGEILATLEQYFGVEYPWGKLDIIAVPDMNGAMENAGAVTFSDSLLLMNDKTASERQKRGYATDMAHELAHQWTGNLVTAAWWDDIWLNEALATWMEAKAADAWDPRTDAATELLRGIQGAMESDSLVSARSIRQPIESTDDIENAFDSITYQKGGGTLRMFEHWLGAETFQRGVRRYLTAKRFGSATADDFLDVLSQVAGKDVKTPFRSFLDQPGVPFVEANVECGAHPHLHLKQTRYLPMGSSGDANKTWQIPLCARLGVGKEVKEECTLLDKPEGDLSLGGTCPDWVMPNAGALGYYRFSLAPADLAALRSKGFSSLSAHERVALGNGLRASFARGTLPMKEAIVASLPFADDPHTLVATEPMGFLRQARSWLYDDPARPRVEAFSRDLFGRAYGKLGWRSATGDDGDRAELRARVIGFLALTGRDAAVRAEAKRRAIAYLGYKTDGRIHPEAVDGNLASVALEVAGQDADRPLWDAMRVRLETTDEPELRRVLLGALTAVRLTELARDVRELSVSGKLRETEVLEPLYRQLAEPEMRNAAWSWMKDNWDRLLAAVPADSQSQLVYMAGFLCDDALANDVESFFTADRLSKVDGGPRVRAGAIESVRLCAIRRLAAEPSARLLFKPPGAK